MNQSPTQVRAFATILAVITLLALGLRLYRLDAESLYMDEIVTAETFPRDPLGIVLGAAMVGQPPLDNFVGAAVYRLGLGQSDWWLRFPPVIFGAGAVLLLGLWVRRLAGDVAGLTAALLLTVCPLHAYMSQEVRPYSLMFLLAILCGLTYVRARERSTPANWTLFSCVTFAMLMTRWTDPHFVVLGICMHTLAAAIRTRSDEPEKRRLETRRFHGAMLSTAVAYAAYAPFFFVVLHYQQVAIRPPGQDWSQRFASLLYEGYAALLAGYSTRTVFQALPGSQWLLIAGGLLALLGLVAAFIQRKAAARDTLAFWWIFIPFPFVYAFVYALLGDAVPKPQYLLVMAIPIFACMAIALDAARSLIRRPFPGIACFAAALLMVGVPMVQSSWDALWRIDKCDWRGAMGFLKEHAAPGDVAVCMGSDTTPPAFRPKAYGKDRYGPGHLRFIPVSTDTSLDAFSSAAWWSQNNSVWMLVYTDRMYTGVDHVVPPACPSCHAERSEASEILRFAQDDKLIQPQSDIRAVHTFNGLFLVELASGKPAIERLMDTIGHWYVALPAEASIPAPALLRWRYSISHGNSLAAAESLAAARRQCPSKDELLALEEFIWGGEALAWSEP